jgi:hypothetical protein
MVAGERVRIYVATLVGAQSEQHVITFHGHSTTVSGWSMEGLYMQPGMVRVMDMHPYTPGTFVVSCHFSGHFVAGMTAIYRVADNPNIDMRQLLTGSPRVYYIGAVIGDWDYCPLGYDGITDLPWNSIARPNTVPTASFNGCQYKKAMYKQFTDDTFTVELDGKSEFIC